MGHQFDGQGYEPHGQIPAKIDQQFALELARRLGVERAAKQVGVSRLALASVAAGLPTFARTIRQVQRARAGL